MSQTRQKLKKAYQKRHSSIQTTLGSKIPNLFWCRDYKISDRDNTIDPDPNCCFWHRRGLPERFGFKHPMYEYEEDIIDSLNDGIDLFWILKMPKMGITEFWLTWAIHQAMINEKWKGGQVAIVVGTRGKEAEHMIARCKEICSKAGIKYEEQNKYNTKTEFFINGVLFAAHPADNIDSIRSQPNMRFILIDEGGFFRMLDQSVVQEAVEHYVGGADLVIVYVSTAGKKPAGFMYEIGEDTDSIYTKFNFCNPEKYGLTPDKRSGTIPYIKAKIDLLRTKISFKRNFLGQWGYGAGDIFDLDALNHSFTINYDVKLEPQYPNVLVLDPAYGSSLFGCVGLMEKEGKIYVIDAEGWKRNSDSEALEKIRQKLSKGYRNLIIDGHYTGLIKEFSEEVNTNPFHPTQEGEEAVNNSSKIVSEDRFRGHPRFTQLLREMRASRRKENGLLDKTKKSLDLSDSVIMGLGWFKSGEGEVV